MFLAPGFNFDPAQHRETNPRRALRSKAEAVLGDRKNLVIRGPEGSGRQAFLLNLLRRQEDAGRLAVLVSGYYHLSAQAFIDSLYASLVSDQLPQDPVSRIEGVYEALIRAFARGGVTLFFPYHFPLSQPAREELEILCDLKLFGRNLVTVAIIGVELMDAQTLDLDPFTPDELSRIISHRLTYHGLVGELTKDDLAQVAAMAHGPGSAIFLAERRLARGRFLADLTKKPEESPKEEKSIFCPDTVAEVGKLLDQLKRPDQG